MMSSSTDNENNLSSVKPSREFSSDADSDKKKAGSPRHEMKRPKPASEDSCPQLMVDDHDDDDDDKKRASTESSKTKNASTATCSHDEDSLLVASKQRRRQQHHQQKKAQSSKAEKLDMAAAGARGTVRPGAVAVPGMACKSETMPAKDRLELAPPGEGPPSSWDIISHNDQGRAKPNPSSERAQLPSSEDSSSKPVATIADVEQGGILEEQDSLRNAQDNNESAANDILEAEEDEEHIVDHDLPLPAFRVASLVPSDDKR
jgi:hypothetical protein